MHSLMNKLHLLFGCVTERCCEREGKSMCMRRISVEEEKAKGQCMRVVNERERKQCHCTYMLQMHSVWVCVPRYLRCKHKKAV